MNDRELLKLAAKAAGIEITAVVEDGIPHRFGGGYWNPLEDDGDALRLEIKLRLDVVAFSDEWHVTKRIGGKTFSGVHADRKRATTMCAAEIGKTL